MFCPKCGAKVDSNAGFCSECGASLKGETSVTQTTIVSENEGSTFGWGSIRIFYSTRRVNTFYYVETRKTKSI